ncbi:sulfatase family protein [Isoptericola aurantiacus]|uniref:sulfatase family protein n=1 Tax=Isoptericola aurantiacus TaxID=3377839 RepID=UPI00383A8AC8
MNTPESTVTDPSPTSAAAGGRRPNVLFVLGDDWGWGDLGCFGHQRARTPHLDRLAAEGTRYTQFYVASPLCSPSRASFLTGLFPGRVGFHHVCSPAFNRERGVPDWLDTELPMLPRHLQATGYRTCHLGKWHLGHTADAPTPGAYGFDQHHSTLSSDPSLVGRYFARRGLPVPEDADEAFATFRPYSSETIADEAVDWLEHHRDTAPDEPFFLQLWLLDMHSTLDPAPEHLERYAHLEPEHTSDHGSLVNYYATLTEADRQVGRVLEALDRLGLTEDTIVVFTGDNGPEEQFVVNNSHSAAGSAGPFRGRKRSLYEGGVRMPLIVRWPGRTPAFAVDDDSVLSSVDLFATLGAVAGFDVPGTDGEDVGDAWQGTTHRRDRPLLWEHRFPNGSHQVHRSPMTAVRDGDWKLLRNPDGSRVELYDVPRDPWELTDHADREPEVVARLTDSVTAYSASLPDGPRHPDAGRRDYPWPTSGTVEVPTWDL